MNSEELQRGLVDFVLFGMVFFGFVLGAVGVVTTSIPAAVIGFLLIAAGLGGFLLKSALFS